MAFPAECVGRSIRATEETPARRGTGRRSRDMGGEVGEMRRGWAGGCSGGLREEGAVVLAIGRGRGVGSPCEIERHAVIWLRLMRRAILVATLNQPNSPPL